MQSVFSAATFSLSGSIRRHRDARRWLLAFGLAAPLQLLLLGLITWTARPPASVPSFTESGTTDLAMNLLAAADTPRPGRFLEAPAPTVPTPARPSGSPVPSRTGSLSGMPVDTPVMTAAPASVSPDIAVTAPALPSSAISGTPAAPAAPNGALTDDPGAGRAGASGPAASDGVAPAAAGEGNGLPAHAVGHPYFGRLKAWLQRYKTYPADLKKAKRQGTVVLAFTLDRHGVVQAARVQASSGEPGLDQAALDMLRRASPLPPLPDDLGLDRLSLTIPVEYSLITR